MAIFLPFKLSNVLYGARAINQYDILSEENQMARVAKPVSVAFTDEGRAEAMKELGTTPPLPAPFPIAIIGPDEYLTVDGDYKGMRGKFVRDADGKVVSIDLGGRLAHRAAG